MIDDVARVRAGRAGVTSSCLISIMYSKHRLPRILINREIADDVCEMEIEIPFNTVGLAETQRDPCEIWTKQMRHLSTELCSHADHTQIIFRFLSRGTTLHTFNANVYITVNTMLQLIVFVSCNIEICRHDCI